MSYKSGRNTGVVCYNCQQIWQSRYRHKGLNTEALRALIGSDTEEHKRFHSYRNTLIDRLFINSGGRTRVAWTDIETRVVSLISQKRVSIERPPDQYWAIDFYRARKGDPAANGHRDRWDANRAGFMLA